MTPLHEELRRIREDRGISRDAIIERIRIRPDFFDRLEAGDFSFLPMHFIRAFLREYAAVVGIDPGRVMDRLDNRITSIMPVTPAPAPSEPAPSEPAAPAPEPSEPEPVSAAEPAASGIHAPESSPEAGQSVEPEPQVPSPPASGTGKRRRRKGASLPATEPADAESNSSSAEETSAPDTTADVQLTIPGTETAGPESPPATPSEHTTHGAPPSHDPGSARAGVLFPSAETEPTVHPDEGDIVVLTGPEESSAPVLNAAPLPDERRPLDIQEPRSSSGVFFIVFIVTMIIIAIIVIIMNQRGLM